MELFIFVYFVIGFILTVIVKDSKDLDNSTDKVLAFLFLYPIFILLYLVKNICIGTYKTLKDIFIN